MMQETVCTCHMMILPTLRCEWRTDREDNGSETMQTQVESLTLITFVALTIEGPCTSRSR